MKLRVLPFTLLVVSSTLSAAVAVIVHRSNANASTMEQVSKRFLGRDKTFPEGSQAVPAALADANAATQVFNSAVLKKSASQLKSYWSKLVFLVLQR